MDYENADIQAVRETLLGRLGELDNPADVLKAAELKALYAQIPALPAEQRAAFGKEINALKQELQGLVDSRQSTAAGLPPIDVTAPFDANVGGETPRLLPSEHGSKHPLMTEL